MNLHKDMIMPLICLALILVVHLISNWPSDFRHKRQGTVVSESPVVPLVITYIGSCFYNNLTKLTFIDLFSIEI